MPRSRDDRGAAAIIVAVLSVVLLGMVGFVTDLGLAYVNRQAVQNGADSAALAVAQQIVLTAEGGQDCAEIRDSMSADMRVIAEQYFNQNVAVDATLVDGDAGFVIGCDASTRLVTVDVAGRQLSPTFFEGVLNADEGIAVQESATAVVGPAGEVTGVRPFALCRAYADRLVAAGGANIVVPFDNADIGCGSASGNWGVMDFNGGSNPTGEVANWIANGYKLPISSTPSVFTPGNPGAPNPGALDDEMNLILDAEVVLPVWDAVTGTGNNSQFRISGFIGVKVCGWKFNNKSGQATCFTPVSAPVSKNYLQVQYRRFIPVGEVSASCFLGDNACDNGLRMLGMAR